MLTAKSMDKCDCLQCLSQTHLVSQNTTFSMGAHHPHDAAVHELQLALYITSRTWTPSR